MNAAELFIFIAFIFVLLVTFFLFKNKPIASLNFYLRVRSWAWMLGILVVFTFLDAQLLPLLFLFMGVVSLWEIATVSGVKLWRKGLAVTFTSAFRLTVIISIILSMIFSASYGVEVMIAVGVLNMVVLSTFVFCTGLHSVLKTNRARLFVPLAITFILLIIFMMSLSYLHQQGFTSSDLGYWLYLIFSTQFSDVSQYFFGKKFGKHQLSTTISPNKTAEGAIGGILFASICSMCVALYITPLAWGEAILISFFLALLGLAGDLYISWFKRQVGVKDMGTLIPGHGGILDRIDSLLFATPVLVIILVNLSASIQ